jgi:hypothetical protein
VNSIEKAPDSGGGVAEDPSLLGGRLGRALASKRVFLAFLFVYFLVGTAIFRDYGISSDERISRVNACVTVVHVGELLGFDGDELRGTFGKVPPLENWKDKDYGVLFEVPLLLVEKAIGIESTKSLYQFRHIATFAVFTVGLLIFYLFGRMVLARGALAFLATALLATTPKIFAHAFYNSKDIPFMVACTAGGFTLLRFLRKPTLPNAALHGVACAAAVALRIPGVYLVAATFAIVLVELITSEQRGRWLRCLGAFAIATCLAVYAFWPYLWSAPFENFAQAFDNMSKFRYKRPVLYEGEWLKTTELPWSYIPQWIAMTIPPILLVMILLGAVLGMKQLLDVKRYVQGSTIKREPALILGLGLVPLVAVIALNSVLYDSWRQMFFIYPFLILTAMFGVRWLAEDCSKKYAVPIQGGLLALFAVQMFTPVLFMVRNHPHQAVYFNGLAGKDPALRFEADSYGTAYYQALKFVLDHKPDGRVLVGVNRPVGRLKFLMLDEQEKERMGFGPTPRAEYFLSNYRLRPAAEVHRKGEASYENPPQLTEVDGNLILGVYKVKP